METKTPTFAPVENTPVMSPPDTGDIETKTEPAESEAQPSSAAGTIETKPETTEPAAITE